MPTIEQDPNPLGPQVAGSAPSWLVHRLQVMDRAEESRLRCRVHRTHDVLAQVPESVRAGVKAQLLAIRDAPTYRAGQATVKQMTRPGTSTIVAFS